MEEKQAAASTSGMHNDEQPIGNENAATGLNPGADHEASTSAALQAADQFHISPTSTSTDGLHFNQPGSLERTLSELAFSKFRNSMRVEARRSSARRSLLGRLGAADQLMASHDSAAVAAGGQVNADRGQDADGFQTTHEEQNDVQEILAYERYAKANFSEHNYGVGRMIWKRIPLQNLIQHSRDSLRAPLHQKLEIHLCHRAVSVFARLKGYMEDPLTRQTGQPTVADVARAKLEIIRLKLELIRLKLQPLRAKLEPAIQAVKQKLEKLMGRKLCVPRTRNYHLQQILLLGIKFEGLRDEIFCQICKQTTRNPDRLSYSRGWQAMAVCVGTFPPSDNFRAVLMEHFKQVQDGTSGLGLDEVTKEMAIYCLQRLQKVCETGPRYMPPSLEEITAAESMQRISIDVQLPGGNFQPIFLDSMTTGGEITVEIADKLAIRDVDFYGIFIVVDGVERYAGSDGYLLEAYNVWNVAMVPVLEEGAAQCFWQTRQFVMRQCAECVYNMDPDSVFGKDVAHGISVLDKQRKCAKDDQLKSVWSGDGEEIVKKPFSEVHLMLKRKLFPPHDRSIRIQGGAFEYAQAVHDVTHGLYVLEESDAVMLGALQLRAEHGSVADFENCLTVDIVDNYGPKEFVTGYEKVWRAAILKNVVTFPWEIDVNVCMNDYIDYLRSKCPLYGSSWFYVQPKLCPALPREIYVALNFSGVYFVDVGMKEQLLYLRFIEICSWGHSLSFFSLVTGNMSYNLEFRLGTRQGKEIAQTLQYFITHMQL